MNVPEPDGNAIAVAEPPDAASASRRSKDPRPRDREPDPDRPEAEVPRSVRTVTAEVGASVAAANFALSKSPIRVNKREGLL
jgi:hypothetical protein